MVNVDIDRDLYNDIKKFVNKNKYLYPSVKFFVQKAVYKEIQNIKGSNNDFDKFYSKIKEILRYDPELRSRINKIYDSEVKKIKDKERRLLFNK